MGSVEQLFQQFCAADTQEETLNLHACLAASLGLDEGSHKRMYSVLKKGTQSRQQAKSLWAVLDKRRAHQEYAEQTAAEGTKIMIIGAGPCGLRMAIECALLGAEVAVVEKRTYISRNNILHLWPFVIADCKEVGAKTFYPQFCTGERSHVSIRKLQLMLMKTALVLGVKIHVPVEFVGLVEPRGAGEGWKAKIEPSNHLLNNWEFDIIVGADGKQNKLTDFKRNCFRAQQALGITANFVYHRGEETKIPELGGVVKVFKPQLFKDISKKTGLDLENIVYFKGDTHYFVFTATRESLIRKRVIKKDAERLLAPENIDRARLEKSIKQVAKVTTNGRLRNMEFSKDHHGRNDMAIFDFTAMYKAEYSCFVRCKNEKKLLMAIVGDTLLEPFWPTGSGCARGFLSAMDAAWLIRGWCMKTASELELLAERETIYQLLSQTKPDNMPTDYSEWTIDPKTRYGMKLKATPMSPQQVAYLMQSGPKPTKKKKVPTATLR